MKFRQLTLILVPLCAAQALAGPARKSAQSGTLTLPMVLQKMDEQAKTFRSLTASVERTKVTVVVDDHSSEKGELWVRDSEMLLKLDAPDKRTVLKTGSTLYLYTPGLNRVEKYNLGKNRALVDQFLLLGFGTPGGRLAANYDVKLVDEPQLNGKKTAHLQLTPKSPRILRQISNLEIWLDETTWLAVRQRIVESGSGDYSVVTYSNIVRNPKVSGKQFKPRWPRGAKVVSPQT